uniref:Uncharacterized protein n=1 Tax=Anguilla anguilla TaxID=7936 RepID=A0A0E9RKI0_ANGAN
MYIKFVNVKYVQWHTPDSSLKGGVFL